MEAAVNLLSLLILLLLLNDHHKICFHYPASTFPTLDLGMKLDQKTKHDFRVTEMKAGHWRYLFIHSTICWVSTMCQPWFHCCSTWREERGQRISSLHCFCFFSGKKIFPRCPLKFLLESHWPEMSHMPPQKFWDCQRLAQMNIMCVGCITENIEVCCRRQEK